MANTREPILQPIPILSLHPTQMTVGMREVKEKRKRLREHWRKHKKIKQGEFLGRHMIPVVLGPDERDYVVDHHQLARAMHDEGVEADDDNAREKALALAKSKDALYLPGWCGPASDD